MAAARPSSSRSAPTGGAHGPIRLAETVPAVRSQYTYLPPSTWQEVASGSGDTRKWKQPSTDCSLYLLSMADPQPTVDGPRSTQLVQRISHSDKGKDMPGPAVVVPSENERAVEFAQRQAVDKNTYRGYAARAFTRSGGLLIFQLDCPAARARPGLLATTLAAGKLIHVR